MQMQLSSHDAQIPDGLLAAMKLLNEKPRLGFRTSENTPYPAFPPTQSTTALRDSWSVASGTCRVSLSCDFGVCAPAGGNSLVGVDDAAEVYGIWEGLGALSILVRDFYHYEMGKRDIKQFNDALKKIQQVCGKTLSPDQQRQLHDHITKQGIGGYWDIVQEGVTLFCPDKKVPH